MLIVERNVKLNTNTEITYSLASLNKCSGKNLQFLEITVKKATKKRCYRGWFSRAFCEYFHFHFGTIPCHLILSSDIFRAIDFKKSVWINKKYWEKSWKNVQSQRTLKLSFNKCWFILFTYFLLSFLLMSCFDLLVFKP